MRVDLHVHLAAAGVDGASISDRFRRSVAFRFLSRSLSRRRPGEDGFAGRGARPPPTASGGWAEAEGRSIRTDDAALTAAYADRLLAGAGAAREVDALVVLALDRPYSEVGVPLAADLHVPDRAAAALCARSPRLLLGASVHPYRPDALDALDEAKALGAVLVKWLPNTQGIDPASPLCQPFYRRLCELGLPLLSHTGDEHTLPHRSQALGDPARLVPALDAGVTVIAAHAGTRGSLAPQRDLGRMAELCGRHPRLFLECSGCATPGRYGAFRQLLFEPSLADRWVYGSDFPVPVFWPLLWGRSDPALRRRAVRSKNPFDSRALAFLAAGLPERALHRGGELCGR